MTDRGGWRSASLETICPKCREERLVIETTIYGRKSYFCEVCAHGWMAEEETPDVLVR